MANHNVCILQEMLDARAGCHSGWINKNHHKRTARTQFSLLVWDNHCSFILWRCDRSEYWLFI